MARRLVVLTVSLACIKMNIVVSRSGDHKIRRENALMMMGDDDDK